jgi:predicted Rossmann fold flavoprotein
MNIAVIGGGAAGFFAAISCAETYPHCRVSIFERGKSVLEKVRISGGGRCNVTHACFDARALVQHYPRGSRELLGPFMQFGPQQTIEWFERRGVSLKTEADGRMFPTTDDSGTIVDCLTRAAHKAGVQVHTSTRIEGFSPKTDGSWWLSVAGQPTPMAFDRLMVASGSNTAVWDMLQKVGHTIVTPVPSLFTFNTKDTRLRDLAGVSVPDAIVNIAGADLEASGPLLVTHWGLSGPAVLRLSAWGARALHERDYKFELTISWLSTTGGLYTALQQLKTTWGKKMVQATAPFQLPLRLWQRLTAAAALSENTRWGDLNKGQLEALEQQLSEARFYIGGKSTFKEEFVTSGGVALKEIDFKRFASRLLPNLFMAGEVLDIDAITGGFNFQAAWTGGWLAGQAMGR